MKAFLIGLAKVVLGVVGVLAGVIVLADLYELAAHLPAELSYVSSMTAAQWKDLIETVAAIVAAAGTTALAVYARSGLKQLEVGFKQLEISKQDVRIRSEREAKSAAIAQCERFRTEIIPAYSKLLKDLATAGVPLFASEEGELSFNGADQGLVRRARDWLSLLSQAAQDESISVLNALEVWALSFNIGIADSETAFRPTSDVFCRSVVQLYAGLIYLRGTREPELFSNIEQLYRDWHSREHAKNLERQSKTLSLQMEALEKQIPNPGSHRKPIGTDI